MFGSSLRLCNGIADRFQSVFPGGGHRPQVRMAGREIIDTIAFATASCVTQHYNFGIHMRARLQQVLQQSRCVCPGDKDHTRWSSLGSLLLTEQSNAIVSSFVGLDSSTCSGFQLLLELRGRIFESSVVAPNEMTRRLRLRSDHGLLLGQQGHRGVTTWLRLQRRHQHCLPRLKSKHWKCSNQWW